jgi:small Trp-rich protein
MFFLIIAVILTALKVMEIAPIASLSWMWIFALYGLATAWWAWADSSGFTKRKQQEKMDDKVKKRMERQKEALGLGVKKK